MLTTLGEFIPKLHKSYLLYSSEHSTMKLHQMKVKAISKCVTLSSNKLTEIKTNTVNFHRIIDSLIISANGRTFASINIQPSQFDQFSAFKLKIFLFYLQGVHKVFA